jgi:hypothetical protein
MRKCFAAAIFILAVSSVFADGSSEKKARENIIKFLRSSKMNKELDGPVTVTAEKEGLFCIRDPGNYLTQYMIAKPDSKIATDPNVVIDDSVNVPVTVKNAVIVTHGWIDKGANDWPEEIAAAIGQRIDPNEWVCGYFDWKAGAIVLNPVDAVRYARDIAAPRLTKAFLAMLPEAVKLNHIHIIAHSAGAWTATIAAEKIATATGANVHLTLLDAYIPPNWDRSKMGDVPSATKKYAEHYYSKDITLNVTARDLANAHNIDVTDIQPGLKTHEFPYRWYLATVMGKYRKKDHIKGEPVVTSADGVSYGFGRGLETGEENFKKSLSLKKGEKAVKLKRTKKKRKLFDISTWF